jgi:hypothetical protein
VLDSTLHSVLQTIQDSINPEIYHFRYGTHPGQKYYIKTIVPGPRIINDDTYVFWQFWETLANRYPRLVKLIDYAFDWHGNHIPHWWTIWLEERIDITWTWSRRDGIDFHLIDYDLGLKYSGKKAVSLFEDNIDRLSPEDQVCLDQLKEIADFLYNYTSERQAESNRKKFTVIDNDNIHNKTDNRN